MEPQAAILIPGGLRWRSLVPLEDPDGICEALYDLERNLLVEVPDVFQYHIAMALELGSPDEALLGWLAREDLLTYEHNREAMAPRVAVSEVSKLAPLQGCVYFVENRAHCRISDGSDQAALETLDCLLSPEHGAARLTLHIDGEGGRLSFESLQRIVEETRARAQKSGCEISYELRLDSDAVSAELAAFLSGHPFRVRVRCDGPPLGKAMHQALELLRHHLQEKLIVHSVVRDGSLLSLWQWAKSLGLQQLHATRLAPRHATGRELEVRRFRRDLATICDDMLEGLQAEVSEADAARPLLYEPVTRVVRRISREAPLSLQAGAACVGFVSHGHVFPVFPGARVPLSAVDSEHAGLEDEAGEGTSCRQICHACTSRRLCGRGLAADPALSGIERVDIWGRHCDFWRAEVETGLLFYRRLKKLDPDFLLGLAGGSSDAFVDPPDTAADYFEWRTC